MSNYNYADIMIFVVIIPAIRTWVVIMYVPILPYLRVGERVVKAVARKDGGLAVDIVQR